MTFLPHFIPVATLLLTVLGSVAQAATFTVDRTDDANVAACSGATNDCTLRGAINAANANAGADTIDFTPGTAGDITLGGTALPTLGGDVTLNGPGANLMSVSGNGQSGIVRVASGATALIRGLTLTNGNASASPTRTGGAIDIENGATVVAEKLWIKDNQAFGGGGIENFGTLTVRDSAFSGNMATVGTGGAIHSTPNSAGLTISNSTFTGNRAASSGGAIRSDIANTALSNLTVVTNLADSDGNGSGVGGGVSAGGSAFAVRNSIIASNSGGDVDNVTTVGGFNFVNGRAVDAGLETVGAFIAFKNNGGPTPTIAINASGAAFNGGDPNFVPVSSPFDQRGDSFLRVKAGRLDIGAFELQSEAPSLIVTTTQDIAADDDMTSLREAINFANTNFDASTISFAPGVSGAIELQTALPKINFATTILGPGADVLTITRAGGAAPFGLLLLDSDRPPFTASPFAARISGLSFSGGNATSGGAIFAKKANLTIEDCVFTGNTAFNGGAVYGALEVKNSTFSGNIANHNGGAFYSLNAATLTQCTLDGNSATDFGGGVFGVIKITLDSCTITGNRANSTGNANGGNGGGLVAQNVAPLLRNCIVAGNSRGASGGTRDDIAGAVDSASSFNLVGDGSGSSGINNGSNGNQVGTSGAPLDPLLDALQNNGGPTPTRALQSGSPAFDAGATDLATDQRGVTRPQGAADDIGAFETPVETNAAPIVEPTINSPSVPGPDSLIITDPHGSDADGDTLTYTFVYAINGTVIAGETDKPNRVDLSKYSVNVGDTFTATFTANDGKVDSAPVTLTRTIAAPPVANDASGTAEAGVRSAIGPITGTDPNGLALRYVLLTQPNRGSAFLAGDADNIQLYYTSARSFSGADSVTFQVVNSEGRRSAPATIGINVVKTNNAPTASNGSATVTAGVRQEIPLVANDADGDALRYRIVSGPSNGSAFLANNTNGGVSLFYTANKNASGADSVQFTVTDPAGATSAPATISITVAGNSAPVANATSLDAISGERASVLLSGSDADGDELVRYRITTQPAHGSAFLAGSGANVRLYYTSNAGYSGPDSVKFTVTDSTGRTSAPATISVNVSGASSGQAS